MKRFLTLAVVVAFFALLLTPSTTYAKGAPGLVLKTTEVTVTISPMFPTFSKIPVAFGNRGSVPLGWKMFTGSDFGGCAVESPVNWLTILPNTGTVEPRATTEAFLMVDARKLEPGTHQALLCLHTNDPFNDMVTIPFTVNVK
jgi:hypothetical protein